MESKSNIETLYEEIREIIRNLKEENSRLKKELHEVHQNTIKKDEFQTLKQSLGEREKEIEQLKKDKMALEQKLKVIHQALQEDFGTGKEQDTVPSSEKKAHEESSPPETQEQVPLPSQDIKSQKNDLQTSKDAAKEPPASVKGEADKKDDHKNDVLEKEDKEDDFLDDDPFSEDDDELEEDDESFFKNVINKENE